MHHTGVGSNYYEVCEKAIASGDEFSAEILKGLKDVMKNEKSTFYFEYPCHSPKVYRSFGMRATKFNSDVPMIVVAHMDISERKLAEEKLGRSKARLKEAQALAHIGNWEINLLTNTHTWSSELYNIYGIDKSEVQPSAQAFLSFIHPADVAFAEKKIREAFETFVPSFMNFRFITKNGVKKYGYSEWRFEFDKTTTPIRLYGILQDVTEQKRAELILIESESRLAEAQAIAKVGNRETDLSMSKVVWSEETFRIFDCTLDDFDPSHPGFLSFVHPDDRNKVAEAFNNSLITKSINSIEHRIITKTGEVKFLEERWQTFHDDNGIAIKAAGTCQDISERKRSEYENKFKAVILDTIGQAVIATDMNGNVTFWNQAAVEIYGWTLKEALGKNILGLRPSRQNKANAEVLITKLSQSESWSVEFEVKRKNGSAFTALVYYSPVYDGFGKQIGILEVSSDISERKEHELERLKITNDLLQRNRDLEQFTFIVSHNLRAPTVNIIGFTDILQDETLSRRAQGLSERACKICNRA